MKFRIIKDTGKKPWALIIEENGVQIEKRDYSTQNAAVTARDKMFAEMRGEG